MLLTVLIPIYQLDSDRKRNLEFIYNRLISHYSYDEIEIIFGIQDTIIDDYYSIFDRAQIRHYPFVESSVFNKSRIFNRCCDDGFDGKFLVFLDADIYLPFQQLRDKLSDNQEIIRPFNHCIFLDEETTQIFINEKRAVASKDFKRISATGACCIIINSVIINRDHIRMDEKFYGWGWEDIDFANTLTKKYNLEIFFNDAIHLYHKPSDINYKNYSYYKTKYKYTHNEYNKSIKQDIGIIISYFSPCNYKKPRENLYKMIDSIRNVNCPITIVEGIMPDSDRLKIEKSEHINHIQINLNRRSTLFLKENLYNIGIQNTNYSKMLFLDSDLYFDHPDFIDECSILLDNCDVIQPYEHCIWMDNSNIPLLDYNFKQSILKAMTNKQNINLNCLIHHPGFAWGFTRNFANYTGGFYDRHPVGGGDVALAYALCPENQNEADDKFLLILRNWLNTNQLFYTTDSYICYKKIVQNFKPKIGYLKNCTIYHMYHGQQSNRDYVERNKKYLPNLINNEYPLIYNNDGILEWIKEEDAIKCMEYFNSRLEDD